MSKSGVLFLAMRLGYKVWTVIFALSSVLPMAVVSAAPADTISPLLVTEVKTGGPISGQPTEFVEVRNVSENNVNLTGIVLEYAKPNATVADCTKSWSAQDTSASIKVVELSGALGQQAGIVVEMSMNDNVGGSIKLSDANRVYDVVGWGSSVTPGVCKEGDLAPIPEKGKSIKRYMSTQSTFVDTDNNAQDFRLDEMPLSGTYPQKAEPEPETDVCANLTGTQAIPPYGYSIQNSVCEPLPTDEHTETCKGIVISEVVPNPSGSDSGNEYIEIFNTTDMVVSLQGCILRVGSSNLALSGEMNPGYTAFYGLVLPNAAGGSVELITPLSEEVVSYPENLGDDEAWALIDGSWQLTQQPTPNQPNVLVTGAASNTSSDAADQLSPCPAGKFRNPETNRCKKITSSNGLKPCAEDQVRNPETNRCKKIASLTSSLKPCSAGQVRNPQTNRCRKVSSNGSNLKPCKEGQERNPETNRCRKVAGVSTNTPSENAQSSGSTINYVLIGLFASTVILYAVYEYRDSIGNYVAKLRGGSKK